MKADEFAKIVAVFIVVAVSILIALIVKALAGDGYQERLYVDHRVERIVKLPAPYVLDPKASKAHNRKHSTCVFKPTGERLIHGNRIMLSLTLETPGFCEDFPTRITSVTL